MSYSQYVTSVSVVCYSQGITAPQLQALEQVVIDLRGWSVEFGIWHSARHQSGLLDLFLGGIFFKDDQLVHQFLQRAFEAGVYSWVVDRFAQGHISLRLLQPSH